MRNGWPVRHKLFEGWGYRLSRRGLLLLHVLVFVVHGFGVVRRVAAPLTLHSKDRRRWRGTVVALVGVHARWWVFEKEALLRHVIGAAAKTAQCQLC